jgi:hypothetical protein
VINVQDSPYNAAGDNTTDDTQAIQDAIDAAADTATQMFNGSSALDAGAAAVGGVVFFPKGSYLTTAPLKLPPTVTLVGEGTGSLIRSIFLAVPQVYDLWNGAIELTPDSSGYVQQAGIRDLSIITDIHCGITYDRSKEVWPAKVFTYSGGYTDRTTVNNGLFRNGSYDVLTGTSDYLYLGFTNMADVIPARGVPEPLGLIWTRMKQLGFKDEWGTRLDLVWEYSHGNDGSGNVNTWTQFGGSDLGGGFWHYGHGGFYTEDFSGSWTSGKVNSSNPLFWVRVKTTSAPHQNPVAHHIYPGVQLVITNNAFENLFFNCGNWAMFFGRFCYCQNSIFRTIRTVRNGGGCIWVVGNSNYISGCDTEGGARDTATIAALTEPGQFTIEGDGNSIRDVIPEGGAFGQYPWYCFRGAGLIGENLWVEGGGPDTPDKDRMDCNLQELRGATFDRPPGFMRLENAKNIVIGQAEVLPHTPLSDSMTLVGDSTLLIQDLWGYQHPGDMDNSRVRWNNFHSYSNRGVPLLANATNPVTGNLVVNGDFQNGTHGWTLTTNSGTTTGADHGKVADAPDGRGKELCIHLTGDSFGNGVFVETLVNIPPGYEGQDAFFGFRADTASNCRYERKTYDDGNDPLAYTTLVNSQTAYRIRKIGLNAVTSGTHMLRWRVAPSSEPINQFFKYDGSAFSVPSFGTTVLNAADHHFYIGADLPVSAFDFNVTSASSGLTRTVEYWDGSEWKTVDDLVDNTNNFATTGTHSITFSTPRTDAERWKKRTVNGVGPLYWLRFVASAVTTAPTLDTIPVTRRREGKLYLSNVYCVIGQTHNQVPTTQAQQRWEDGRVEMGAPELPDTDNGRWKTGDILWNTDPSIVPGNPGYHLLGWRRITDSNAGGTNRNLGSDWVEIRAPVENPAPGGSTKQVQYNDAGEFAGAGGLEFQGAASPNVLVTALGAAHIPLQVKGAASQSANLFEILSSSSTVLASVSSAGALTAASFTGSGSGLTTLNASNVSTGTVATARLASGTANSTTFLRGNQTWSALVSDDISDADYLNVPDVLVRRDGSGNFTSNDITAHRFLALYDDGDTITHFTHIADRNGGTDGIDYHIKGGINGVTKFSVDLNGNTVAGEVAAGKRATSGADSTVSTSGSSVSTDASAGNRKRVTASADFTFNAPSNATDGQVFEWIVKNTHGSNTITITFTTGSSGAFRYGTNIVSGDMTVAAGKTRYVGTVYNATDSRWDIISTSTGF